ncbi:uncharacterized protein AB675_2691 [Cyphellophora attinorum]|uniref:Uncharacterized protein n=1 Tax=Cyphellophora attinorum TaxID=1664694 RepID=A0A0N1HGR8_9EURO|nr:uncharacterized protein AB675_2691 [Phialophora attinorum]KPI44953.1 hypothetical protein AB675_2691 [Phialophora attinorum]
MALHSVLLLLIVTFSFIDHALAGVSCASSPPQRACTVTYDPSRVAQTGPTSTVYGAIVTTRLNVVDCRYCTVTNLENNPAPVGPFSERCTESVLTITELGCMTEAVVSTRGGIGSPISTSLDEIPLQTSPPMLDKRAVLAEQELAMEVAEIVDPGNWTLIESIQTYRKQCYSAFVAVSLIISGAEPHLLCNITNNTDTKLSMSNKGLDGEQISNLICFWAVFGYHFSTSTFQVLDTLATAATSFTYAMQYGLNSTQDVARLCGGLNLDDPMYEQLHIDSQGINTVLCSGVSSSSSTSTSISDTTITSFSQTVSAGGGQVVWTSYGSNGSVLVTGTAGSFSWANSFGTGAATATWGASGAVAGTGSAAATGTAVSGSWSGGNESAAATASAVSGSWSGSIGSAWSSGTTISGSWPGGNGSVSAGETVVSGSWSVGTAVSDSASAGSGVNATTGGNGGAQSTGQWSITAGTAASGAGSASWGWNATGFEPGNGPTAEPVTTVSRNGTVVVVGTATADEGPLSLTTFTDANGSVIVSGTAAISVSATSGSGIDTLSITGTDQTTQSAAASFNITASMPGPVVPTGSAINVSAVPSLSWTTSTNSNGSIIVIGTGAVSSAPSFSWNVGNATAGGGASGGVWSSGVGSGGASGSMWSSGAVSVGGGQLISYSGMAWSSWIVSGTPTVAIITGTESSISWGTEKETATITGSGQDATFTIYQITMTITKTIIVYATAIEQTWSVWGAGGGGIISGVGTAGTWTLEGSSFANSSSPSATGSIITDIWPNATQGTGQAPDTGSPASITGSPATPGDVPGGFNVTATGRLNFTSTVVTSGSTHIATGETNTTTTIVGVGIAPFGIAPFGTGAITTNSENVTFTPVWSGPVSAGTGSAGTVHENGTLSNSSWTSSKFSYPDWSTSTSTAS